MLKDKKRVLGRGIGALIGDVDVDSILSGEKKTEKFFMCSVSKILPGKTQPRKHFEESALKELSDSIKEKGVIEPLIVRTTEAGYELIAGERRWRASKMAGLAQVPVVVIDATDEESLEFAIIENIQRQDLNPLEEAEAYRSLMSFGLSQEEVAKRVGKERATVANYLRLLKLPQEVREELAKGSITMGHARALLSIESHAAQNELCRLIITKGLSVREAEAMASRSAKPSTQKPKKTETRSNPVEDELRSIFGTKVIFKERKGKGTIELAFFSADERERLIDLLRSVNGRF